MLPAIMNLLKYADEKLFRKKERKKEIRVLGRPVFENFQRIASQYPY